MNPSERPRVRSRPSPVTLGQLMAGVGASAAFLSLLSTVQGLNGSNDEFYYTLIACVVSYSAYLFFLLWIAFSYFTRTQVLVLLAATSALSSLLIQLASRQSGGIAMIVILILPVLPFALGGLMVRYVGTTSDPAREVAETETLSVLVQNKRQRGLTPQPGVPGRGDYDDEGVPWSTRRRALVAVAILGLGTGAVSWLRRRGTYLDRAEKHAEAAKRCFDEIAAIEQRIEQAEQQGPQSERRLKEFETSRRKADLLSRKAEWHTQKSEEYRARWW